MSETITFYPNTPGVIAWISNGHDGNIRHFRAGEKVVASSDDDSTFVEAPPGEPAEGHDLPKPYHMLEVPVDTTRKVEAFHVDAKMSSSRDFYKRVDLWSCADRQWNPVSRVIDYDGKDMYYLLTYLKALKYDWVCLWGDVLGLTADDMPWHGEIDFSLPEVRQWCAKMGDNIKCTDNFISRVLGRHLSHEGPEINPPQSVMDSIWTIKAIVDKHVEQYIDVVSKRVRVRVCSYEFSPLKCHQFKVAVVYE